MNNTIRQLHRWLSLAFTLAVVVNIAALMLQQQTVWVGLLALLCGRHPGVRFHAVGVSSTCCLSLSPSGRGFAMPAFAKTTSSRP